MRLKMTAAQWVRDGDRILADMPVTEVELTTELDVLFFDPTPLFVVCNPEIAAGVARGLLPVVVWGWAWSAERNRLVKHGFKCWLPPQNAPSGRSEILAAVWPGVRFTVSGDSVWGPGEMFDREPAGVAEKTLPPGNPPPVEPGACAPWRNVTEEG